MSLNKFFSVSDAASKPNKPKTTTALGPFQFKYKNQVYECVGEDREFQIMQFEYLIEVQDFVTLKNRIINQSINRGNGPDLKIIK